MRWFTFDVRQRRSDDGLYLEITLYGGWINHRARPHTCNGHKYPGCEECDDGCCSHRSEVIPVDESLY